MALHFKQHILHRAPINLVQSKTNWCEVCGSGAHETK